MQTDVCTQTNNDIVDLSLNIPPFFNLIDEVYGYILNNDTDDEATNFS